MQNGVLGEAGPEAIMPLSRGAGGKLGVNASGLREAMGGAPGMGGSPVLSMSFETTRFGDTDYVSRDQLEAAMVQTRKQASADGAKRGMSMTLDRLQQSPQTRSRVGLR
jgi:phage-related minor tail protein